MCAQHRRGNLKAIARAYVEGVRMALGIHPPDLVVLPHIRLANYSFRSVHGPVSVSDVRRVFCTLVRIYGYKERLYAYPD
jgi:hypothetical protein